MLSRNRSIFLTEAIKNLYRWPGIKFELIVFSNDSDEETWRDEYELSKEFKFKLIRSHKNIGFGAIPKMIKMAKGKYYVWYEDDFIWTEKNWLKKLVDLIEKPPKMKKPWKSKWGILSTTAMIDNVTNGAMWADHFKDAVSMGDYLVTETACGAPFIFDRRLALRLMPKGEIPTFGLFDAMLNSMFVINKYPVAHVNIKAYHANGLFYSQLYEGQARDKQMGDRIKEAAGFLKKAKKDPVFNYQPQGMEFIYNLLIDGEFKEYADKLGG